MFPRCVYQKESDDYTLACITYSYMLLTYFMSSIHIHIYDLKYTIREKQYNRTHKRNLNTIQQYHNANVASALFLIVLW